MQTLILAAIRCCLMFTAVTVSVFCVQPAQAFTMTLQQVGSNVVANGSGAFNLSGLTGAGNIDGGFKRGPSKYWVYRHTPCGWSATRVRWIHWTDEFWEQRALV